MEFKLETALDYNAKEYLDQLGDYNVQHTGKYTYIHINSLEDLLELQKVLGHLLIISSTDDGETEVKTIEIYDTYRE